MAEQRSHGGGQRNYHDVLAIPAIDGLTPVYFVDLKLRNNAGDVVSRNFYWLPLKKETDYRALCNLPPVKLKASCRVERLGEESVIRTRVENPSDHVAFFVHLVLTRSDDREEVLPVFWDDNYISLAPHETRELTARVAAGAFGKKEPVLEVGGWNIQTEYQCKALKVSQTQLKAKETLTVTAQIADTFLDGSRVTLLVDGQPVDKKWAWARGQSGRRGLVQPETVATRQPSRERRR